MMLVFFLKSTPYDLSREFDKQDLKRAIYYTIERIKIKGWLDSYETEIVNKAEYLYSTIRNNALYNESEPERLKKTIDFSHFLKK